MENATGFKSCFPAISNVVHCRQPAWNVIPVLCAAFAAITTHLSERTPPRSVTKPHLALRPYSSRRRGTCQLASEAYLLPGPESASRRICLFVRNARSLKGIDIFISAVATLCCTFVALRPHTPKTPRMSWRSSTSAKQPDKRKP